MSLSERLSGHSPLMNLNDVVRRFPIPAVLCGMMFMAGCAISLQRGSIADTVLFFFIPGFFWAVSTTLAVESLAGKRRKNILWAGSTALFAFFSYLSFGAKGMENLQIFIPVTLLLVMAAPFLFAAEDSRVFWRYNRAVWSGAVLAFIASFLLFAAASAILFGINALFDTDLDLYATFWVFSATLFAPFLALSLIPTEISASGEEIEYPKSIAFLVTWVFIPLLTAYAALLYIYSGKIILLQELPRGALSSMILGMAGAGVTIWLASWPLRENGPKTVVLFQRYFFAALLPLLPMLAVAVSARIREYGVTEPRYYIVAALAWFVLVIVAFFLTGFLKRSFPLKFIPLSLAVILALGSFGPWGATARTLASQFGILERLLTENGLLADGKLIPVKGRPAFSAGIQEEIARQVSYLDRLGVEIVYWDSGIRGGCRQGGCKEDVFLDYLYLDRVSGDDSLTDSQSGKGDVSKPFSLNCGDDVFDISGFDTVSPITLYVASDSHTIEIDREGKQLSFTPKLAADGRIRLEGVGGENPPVFDLTSAVTKGEGGAADPSCPLNDGKGGWPIILDIRDTKARFRLIASHIAGRVDNAGKIDYDSVEGLLLISVEKDRQ